MKKALIDRVSQTLLNHRLSILMLEIMPYKVSKDFVSWGKIVGAITAITIGMDSRPSASGFSDDVAIEARFLNELSFLPPLYALSSEMVAQFCENDITTLRRIIPENWSPSLNKICLIFPRLTVFDSDGEEIVFATAAITLNSEKEPVLAVRGLCSGLGVTESFSKLYLKSGDFDEFASNDFMGVQLMIVALQAFFSIEYSEELIEESGIAASPRKGFAKLKNHDSLRSPRWIGRNFKRIKRLPQGGTHASPSLHWRRGHWRNQPYGKGLKERRLIMLPPVLVGGKPNDDC
jgi:hypothetical protein